MQHITRGGICLLAAAAAAAWADSSAAGPPAAPEGVNLWTTESGQLVFNLFPIPADFCAPGSDPFGSVVPLVGAPLNPATLSSADTIIRRGDVIFPGAGFPRPSVPIPIEIIELSLTSIAPITVTFNGGQNPEQWLLDVDLSAFAVPNGNLDAILQKPNGGTYSANLFVQPRFIFTKVGEPAQIREFDTGNEGVPEFNLTSADLFSLVQPVETPLDIPADLLFPGSPATSNFWFGVDHAIGTLDLFQFDSPELSLSLRTTPIPTPGALALLGLAGLMGTRRRRK